MRILNIAALVVTLAALVLVNTGCMKCGESISEKIAETATEKIVEAAGGGKVDVDAGGNVDLSTLPEYLRYPGMKAVGKFSMSTGEGQGTVWTLESGDARAAIADWYRKSFEAKGWKKGAEMETDESFMLMWGTEDEKEVATVLLTEKDGKTTVSLTHATK